MDVVVFDADTQSDAPAIRLEFRPIIALGGFVAILICSLLCAGGLLFASKYQAQASADALQPLSHHISTPDSTAVSTTTPAAATPQGPSTQATGATAPMQTCVPYATSTVPSAINLATAPEGLTKLIDSPLQYQIYGNSAGTLRSQVQQCAPKNDGSLSAEFTAETAYKMSWQYSYKVVSSGMCQVTRAKVGLHVSQVMPLWQPTGTAPSGLASQWQTFMDSLVVHENGHAALNEQYAQTLLNDLNSFPVTPCDQLPNAVKQLANSDVATLNQANDNYDSSTNHGATQGAILP
jgi:predicted secreted Zn-dependent protease